MQQRPRGTSELAFLLRELGDREEAERVAVRAAEAGHRTAAGVVACWRWDRTLDPALEDALRAGADHHPSARTDLADLLRTSGRVAEAREVLEAGATKGEVTSWRGSSGTCTPTSSATQGTGRDLCQHPACICGRVAELRIQVVWHPRIG